MRRCWAVTPIFALALAACGGPTDEDILTDDKIAASKSAPELPDVELSEDPTPPPAPATPAPDTADGELDGIDANEGDDTDLEGEQPQSDTGLIPASFQGRWGMSVEDCANPRGAGASAIAIGDDWLELPEGRGRLYRTVGDFPERFVGIFNYDGDRGRWSATEELALTGSSNVLIRRVEGGRLRYRRCTRTAG